MIDHTSEAESMFHRIAQRQGLEICRNPLGPDEYTFELVSSLPDDPMVTLGLQNGDALNFGVHDFWCEFFPFEDIKGLVKKTVDGWFTGQSRLEYRWRGQRLIKIELQVKMKNGDWQRVYTHLRSMVFPLWTTQNRIVYRSSLP